MLIPEQKETQMSISGDLFDMVGKRRQSPQHNHRMKCGASCMIHKQNSNLLREITTTTLKQKNLS